MESLHMKFKKIHLTGAAGFVGTYVRELLVDRGYEVIGYDFQSSLNENLNPHEIFSKLAEKLETKQLVIHLGAVASTSISKAHLIREQNIEYTRKLANYASKYDIPLIFASSAAVYGVDMLVSCEPEPKNVYGMSKLESEEDLRNQFQHSLGNLLMLRLFNIYGEGEFKKAEMMSIPSRFITDALKFRKIQIWTNERIRDQSRDFVYVKDIAKIICILVEKHPWIESCIDVGTGISVKIEHVAELISQIHEIKTEFSDFPSYIESQNYQHFTKAKTEDLARLIGVFEFTNLDDRISDMWQYYSTLMNIWE